MRAPCILALIVCLALAACAAGGDNSDNGQRRGFYGGVSSGMGP